MCGGGGGGSSRAAEQQRLDQQLREARIREGMSQIEAIFEGGNYGTGATTLPYAWEQADLNRTYYDARGRPVYNPGDPRSNLYSDADPGRRVVYTGFDQSKGFDDDFYNARSQAYLDYANPQAEDQYSDAREALTFALANAGTLNSSVAADRFGDIEEQYERARRQIADRAADYATDARQSVADERSRLTQLLHSTGDPGAALAGIGDVVSNLRAQPAFDTVGTIFQNVTSGIGNYMQGQRYGDMQQRLNSIFNRDPSTSSGRTVR